MTGRFPPKSPIRFTEMRRRWYSVSIVFATSPSLDEAKAASVAVPAFHGNDEVPSVQQGLLLFFGEFRYHVVFPFALSAVFP